MPLISNIIYVVKPIEADGEILVLTLCTAVQSTYLVHRLPWSTLSGTLFAALTVCEQQEVERQTIHLCITSVNCVPIVRKNSLNAIVSITNEQILHIEQVRFEY